MREIKFRAWDKIDKEMIPNPNWQVCYKALHTILLQYTGLLDKNGKEIYEGDVVKHPVYPKPILVKWHDYEFIAGFYATNNLGSKLDTIALPLCEIIGNIYENPEVLKKRF